MRQPHQPQENAQSSDDRQALEVLVKHLHQSFIESFDSKAFGLYIEPQVKDRETGMEYSAFKRLGDFVVQPDAASMLVAGDPGMGKTLLSLQIAQQAWYLFIRANRDTLLKDPYWADVLVGYEEQGFAPIVAPLLTGADEKSEELAPTLDGTFSLPLWLWMPFLRTEKDWDKQLLEVHLKQRGLLQAKIELLKQACQQHQLRLLPIMDGWDELPPVKENLYLLSGFWEAERWPWLKVLSTCRPEAFVHYEKHGGYKSIFHPRPGTGAYTILNLSPFESRHIDAYVHRYVSTLPENYEPPISSVSVPAAAVKQSKALDRAKAAWIADYEANYFALPKVAKPQSAAESVDEKDEDEEETLTAAIALSLNEQPMDWKSARTYQHYLEHIPGLSQLVQTPFVLSAVMQVLPSIVANPVQQSGQSQQAVTRYTIYQYFVDYWLTTQAKRLWGDPKKQLDLIDFRMDDDEQSIAKLKACLFTYSENLSRLALNLGGGKVEVNLSDEDTLNPSLVIPESGQEPYFKEELVDIKKRQLIRSGCLLQNLGNTFKFLHKSLVEFFAAKTLFAGAHTAADSYLRRFDIKILGAGLSLNEHLLTSEPNIIHLLADKARDDLDFKYLLYQIIELSKGESSVEKAAANAITILNAAGESFSGRDFRGIHIPGAVLNGALCDQTNFEGADLRRVTAHNAWMQRANLRRAQVSGFDFQELPRIKHTALITNLCIASNGKWLLMGDEKGYVTRYSYPKGIQLQQWYRKSRSLMGKASSLLSRNPVLSLTLHPRGRLAACGGIDGSAKLIHIQENRLGARLIPPIVSQIKFLQINASACHGLVFCHEAGQYLALSVKVEFGDAVGEKKEVYEEHHLQIWDVRQRRFLGEYQSSSHTNSSNQLATCNQGNTLLASNDSKLTIFFIADYKGGNLIPVRTFDDDTFGLSRDEQLLALKQRNDTIQLYRTHDWAPLNTISLKDSSCMRALAFSPKGDLLVGKLYTQLHIWDLSSGQHLYTLPVPETTMESSDSTSSDRRLLCFAPLPDRLQTLVAVNDMLYIWPLGQPTMSITYPRSINLPMFFIEKAKFSDETIDINELSIKKGKMVMVWEPHVEEGDGAWILHNKITKETQYISYQQLRWTINFGLSPNQAYLVTRCRSPSWGKEEEFEEGGLVATLGARDQYQKYGANEIRVWDLKQQRLCLSIKHPTLLGIHVIFSMDCQWVVHGTKQVFIHRLEDCKQILQLTVERVVTALALAANKSWLAVADRGASLSLFNVETQQRLYYLTGLPVIIQDLDSTTDSQFLVAKGNKEDVLTFRIIQEKKDLRLQLINNTMELNLVCGEINIEATHGLSQDNQLLLTQNHAQGTPAPIVLDAENKDAEQEEGTEIARELRFDRPVVRREGVYSFLKRGALLSYSLWQVALVRDTQAGENSKHTFIVVEGMDAFGRCFFWRFDLATSIGGKKVEKGFAKVVIKQQLNVLLSEREATLQVFLKNPDAIAGYGLDSLVGHVWQLGQAKVLNLYRAVAADKAKGLLPYAITGKQSMFSTGDNCYSWSRRHLLALKEPEIKAALPSSPTDYFVMHPAWKLKDSLVAAEPHKAAAVKFPFS